MSFVFHVADTKTAKPGAQVRRIGPAAVAEGGTEKQREGNQREKDWGSRRIARRLLLPSTVSEFEALWMSAWDQGAGGGTHGRC